jgi:hypothetical protein
LNTELEHILMTFNKAGMIRWMEDHPQYVGEALELALGNKQPWSWRAAWLLWSCLEENDPRIKDHIQRILKAIPEKKDGHQRELLKILEKMQISEEEEGYLFDLCVSIWERIHKQPSIRWTAFKMILRIAGRYPDLFREINFLTEDRYLETLSPGVKHSIMRMISELEQP